MPRPDCLPQKRRGRAVETPKRVDEILGALRAAIDIPFTVKTRIGYEAPGEFDALLEVFARHPVDAFTVHGRTVRELYRTRVHYDRIRQAVERLNAPVFANGNVLSVALARETIALTGAAGLMIGRGAIRNPWLFQQICDDAEGRVPFRPTLRDLRAYIEMLYAEIRLPHLPDPTNIARMKKYMNFIGQGIGPGEAFLHGIRRVPLERDFFALCDAHLDNDEPFPAEPPIRALTCTRSEGL